MLAPRYVRLRLNLLLRLKLGVDLRVWSSKHASDVPWCPQGFRLAAPSSCGPRMLRGERRVLAVHVKESPPPAVVCAKLYGRRHKPFCPRLVPHHGRKGGGKWKQAATLNGKPYNVGDVPELQRAPSSATSQKEASIRLPHL